MKIRTMLIISLTVFSLFAMILFTLFVSIHFSASSEKQFKQIIQTMSEKQVVALDSIFDIYVQRFENIATIPAVLEYTNNYASRDDMEEDEFPAIAAKAVDALKAAAYEGGSINGIIIFDSENEPLLVAGTQDIDYLMTHVLPRLDENQFGVVSLSVENAMGQNFEVMRYTKIADTQLYILCTYSSTDLEEFMVHSKPSNSGKLILICPLKNLLDLTFRVNIAETRQNLEYAHIHTFTQDERFRNGTEIFNYTVSRERSYALFNEVGNSGWLLGVVGRADDIGDITGNSVSMMVNITIILGLALTGLGIFFTLKFTKPLVVIKDVLTKVHRGDHELRIGNIAQGNEYGKIANEFNELLDNVVIGESRHKTVIEMSDNIIFEWNFPKDEVVFSNNFSKKFSYRAPTDAYKDSFLVKSKVHPEDAANYKKTLDKLSRGESIQQDEFRWKNIFGDYVWFLLRACAIRDKNDEILKVVGVIVDIDNAKKREKILSARANYDALTSLYNRETLEELINNEIDLITARKNEFAILFIDVDDFKFFNDNYSHATGDQVLKFTALTINDIVSNYGMAGRFGGDEFVVCIRNSEVNDPAKTAEEILAKLGEGFMCDVGDQLSVKVSIGIAIIRDTAKRVEEIIGMADEAMYKIKKSGKSNYGFIN